MKKLILFVLSVVVLNAEASKGHSKHKHNHHPKHPHTAQCGQEVPEQPIVQCSIVEKVTNGDFEDDVIVNSSNWQLFPVLTGWNLEWVVPTSCNSSVPLAELQKFPVDLLPGSSQYLELDSDCLSGGQKTTSLKISQDIEAKEGDVLQLSFSYKPRTLSSGLMSLETKLGTNILNFSNFVSTQWQTHSQSFTVTSADLNNGKVSLSLKDTGLPNSFGMFIDNVSVLGEECITIDPNEFEPEAYYIDKKYRKIYGLIVNEAELSVRLKEIIDSPFKSAHMGKKDNTLVVINKAGQKDIKEIDLSSLNIVDAGKMNFPGSLTQVVVKNGKILSNKASTNRLYLKDGNNTSLEGSVFYQGKHLPLIGGDLAYDGAGDLYVVTQFKKGTLYKLNKQGNGNYSATLVARNLGKTSGLALLKNGQMLVSILKSKHMKMVDLSNGDVSNLVLKGAIKKQGYGGDLAN